LRPYILENWKKAGISHDDLAYVQAWAKSIESNINMPNGSEWTPGYEDYNDVIEKLTVPIGRGPKPRYMNRLARWPSEVAKEKAFLELQAFWDEAVDS